MRMIILGGGFLGQLLHVLFPRARVFDWRASAPAIQNRQLGPMYLWEPIPELECTQFDVHTTIDGVDATDESMLAYKRKVGKEQDGGDWRAQFRPHMNGYNCQLPPSRVEYGKRVACIALNKRALIMAGDGRLESYDVLLNTIPLHAMMGLCGWNTDMKHFVNKPIFMSSEPLESREWHTRMAVDYWSSMDVPIYRQTLREDRLFMESLIPWPTTGACTWTKLQPGKIYSTPYASQYVEQLRNHDILSFGRYATWSPDELAHETLSHARRFKATI